MLGALGTHTMKQQKTVATNVIKYRYVALEGKGRWSLRGLFRENFLEEETVKLWLVG